MICLLKYTIILCIKFGSFSKKDIYIYIYIYKGWDLVEKADVCYMVALAAEVGH